MFGKRSSLILTTGYDADRTQQLIRHFEPLHVVLLVQSGKQYGNQEQNVEIHKRRLVEEQHEYKLSVREVDAYSVDHGESTINGWVADNIGRFNIILSSLGPKLSAVAIYRIYERHPDVALCYAPSKEFNSEYSCGIGATVRGRI